MLIAASDPKKSHKIPAPLEFFGEKNRTVIKDPKQAAKHWQSVLAKR